MEILSSDGCVVEECEDVHEKYESDILNSRDFMY